MSEAASPIRRVLAALDAAAPARETLQAAVALATSLHADLEALLLPAPELRRVMSLAAVRHVALLGGAALDPGAASRGLEAAVVRARSELQRATRGRLRWTLRVVEEAAEAEAALGARECLLVVDRTAWARRSGALEGEPGTAPGERCVLVTGAMQLQRTGRAGAPPWVVWDASAAARAALDLGLRLAAGTGAAPRLLVAAPDLREAERSAGRAAAHAAPTWLPWRWAGGASPGDLVRALPPDAFLVVATGCPAVGGRAGRERLLRATRGPVLILV